MKLVTFGAPRAGDAVFATALTVTMLQSRLVSTCLNPIDPVTTEKVIGGKHVGQTVYVNRPRITDLVSPPDFGALKQRHIRDGMRDSIQNPAIPRVAMRYRQMTEMNPTRVDAEKGTRNEVKNLVAAPLNYYATTGTRFERAAFNRNVALRFAIADQD